MHRILLPLKSTFITTLAVTVLWQAAFAAAQDNPARISDAPEPFTHRYGAYWTGINIADVDLAFDGTALTMDIDSLGLVKQFSNYSSTAKTTYTSDASGLVPTSFSTSYTRTKRTRTINMTLDPATGAIVKEAVNPPDNRKKRPAVDENRKTSVLDPMTSILMMRQDLRAALDSGIQTFTFKMYDARRLSDITLTVGDKETITLDKHGEVDVIRMDMQRAAVQGYTKSELRRMNNDKEPVITIFFSDDAKLLPMKVILEVPIGTATLELE